MRARSCSGLLFLAPLLGWLGCAAQSKPVVASSSGSLALPAWAEEDRREPLAATPLRTFSTTRIESEPQRPDPLAKVLQARGSRRLKSLAFHQAPVAEVLRALASLGDFNLVLAEDVPNKNITIDLKNVLLRDAFQAVLAAGQLEAKAFGSEIVFVYRQ